mgnify:CR=1 FL=1
MASSYTDLGVELMVTGENAGTWGTKTNANLDLIEQVLGGYKAVSIAGGAQTTALTVADGALTGTAHSIAYCDAPEGYGRSVSVTIAVADQTSPPYTWMYKNPTITNMLLLMVTESIMRNGSAGNA